MQKNGIVVVSTIPKPYLITVTKWKTKAHLSQINGLLKHYFNALEIKAIAVTTATVKAIPLTNFAVSPKIVTQVDWWQTVAFSFNG